MAHTPARPPPDGPPRNRRGRAVPVLLLLERLLRPAVVHQRERGVLDTVARPGLVPQPASCGVEPGDGGDGADDAPGHRRLLLRATSLRAGRLAHRSEGLNGTYEDRGHRGRLDVHS